jgi:antitoxin HicB
MTKLIQYNTIYTKEPEGGYTVIVPSLPGCISYGENLEEAKKMIQDAIELYLESLEQDMLEIPNDKESFISSVSFNKTFSHA